MAADPFDIVRELGRRLPGVVESTSYGTPSLKVGGKFLTRLREDGDSLVVPVNLDEREMLIERDPETFTVTDHYRPYPAMLVRLSRIEPAILFRLLEQSWREKAPKKLVKAYDEGR